MATKTTICNQALLLIGAADQGASILNDVDTDGTATASACLQFWDDSVALVLDQAPWNFALKRDAPAAASAPSFEFSNAYDLPADCQRVWAIEVADGVWDWQAGSRWRVIGTTLECNVADAKILYTQNGVTSPTLWPATYVKALVYLLGAELAEAIAHDKEKKDELYAMYELALEKARGLDTLQTYPDKSWDSTFTDPKTKDSIINQAILSLRIHRKQYQQKNDDGGWTTVQEDSQTYDGRISRVYNAALQVFDAEAEALLASEPWNFALVRDTLSQDATDPDWEFDHRYEVPAAALRVVAVKQVDGTWDWSEDAAWSVEGGYIKTNMANEDDELPILYISNAALSTPTTWPAAFRKALAAVIAYRLSYAFGDQSATDVSNLHAAKQEAISDARGQDIKEVRLVKAWKDRWTEARFGYESNSDDEATY